MKWTTERFRVRAEELQDELVELRRDFHALPELSFQEAETSARVADRLRELGYSVRERAGGYGVVAELPGFRPGRTIALRADMDALPIAEETGLPYASRREGVMHACGHDAHTAMLLGAARMLAEARVELAGTVRLLFQAAEEVGMGAQAMIDRGALDGVDEIYGLHNLPTLPAGWIGLRPGAMMGSADLIEVEIAGRGGHGAMPEGSADPIVAGSAVVQALQTLASREVSPFEPVVVAIGSFQSGAAGNVIPDRAELKGTVRSFSPAVRQRLPEQLQRIVTQIARAHRCTGMLRYLHRTPVLVNESDCTREFGLAAEELVGPSKRVIGEATLIGEDFACYLERVPGSFCWLGSGPETGAESAYGLHHPKYNLNEACLPIGAALLAAIAWRRAGNSV